jgi:hypothetical protein
VFSEFDPVLEQFHEAVIFGEFFRAGHQAMALSRRERWQTGRV